MTCYEAIPAIRPTGTQSGLSAISGSSWGHRWLLLHLAAVGVRVDVVNCFIDTPPHFLQGLLIELHVIIFCCVMLGVMALKFLQLPIRPSFLSCSACLGY